MPHTRSTYFLELHHFRAFAIANVFFIHVWWLPSSKKFDAPSFFVNGIRELLFHGSTIYFLFISGFLFFFLASKRFTIKRHYWRKFKFVVVPYTIWSLIALALGHIQGTDHRLCTQHSVWERIKTVTLILFEGSAVFVYWFIPVIICLFLVSPLFLKISRRDFAAVTTVASLLPLLGTRTGSELTFQQFLYFAPPFLVGGWVYQHYELFQYAIQKYRSILLLIVFLSSGCIVYITYYSVRFPFVDLKEGLFYVQKMAAACFVTYLLLPIKRPLLLLDLLAKYSFSIYFTHYLLYMITAPFFSDFLEYWQIYGWVTIPLSFLFSACLLVVNLAICILLKKALGNYSRLIMGS